MPLGRPCRSVATICSGLVTGEPLGVHQRRSHPAAAVGVAAVAVVRAKEALALGPRRRSPRTGSSRRAASPPREPRPRATCRLRTPAPHAACSFAGGPRRWRRWRATRSAGARVRSRWRAAAARGLLPPPRNGRSLRAPALRRAAANSGAAASSRRATRTARQTSALGLLALPKWWGPRRPVDKRGGNCRTLGQGVAVVVRVVRPQARAEGSTHLATGCRSLAPRGRWRCRAAMGLSAASWARGRAGPGTKGESDVHLPSVAAHAAAGCRRACCMRRCWRRC